MANKALFFLMLSGLGMVLSACSLTGSSWFSSSDSTTGCDSCTSFDTSDGTSSEDDSVPSTSLPSSHSGSSYLSEVGDFTLALTSQSDGYIVLSYGGNATSIVIPNSYDSKPVLAIGDYLFYQNASILNVTIPSTVETIGMAAFKGCTQLFAIELPSSLTTIGTDAFSGCSGLSSVTYRDRETSALQVIGNNAFEGCPFAQFTLPAMVSEIKSRAFADCAYLGRVDLYGTTPPLRATNSFENCPSGLDFYVPSGALTAYQQAPSWSAYSTHLYNR